jgi:hypothetical protein
MTTRLLSMSLTFRSVNSARASYSGGVEGHQQTAMKSSQSCVDESRDSLPAEDRRNQIAQQFFRKKRCSRVLEFTYYCRVYRNRNIILSLFYLTPL